MGRQARSLSRRSMSFNGTSSHGWLRCPRRLAEGNLLPFLGKRGVTGVWLAFGVGALRCGTPSHLVEPAAEIIRKIDRD
jgi:hypothetical protein